MRGAMWLIGAALWAAVPATGRAADPAQPEISPTRMRMILGFGHWFGRTSGQPKGISTPTVGLGIRPGLPFLELRAQYTLSTKALELPSGPEHLGFAMIEVVASREMKRGTQTLNAQVGPVGLLAHAGSKIGGGFGLVIGIEYLFATGFAVPDAIGVFVHAREVFYRLGSERTSLSEPEAQIDIGVVATAF